MRGALAVMLLVVACRTEPLAPFADGGSADFFVADTRVVDLAAVDISVADLGAACGQTNEYLHVSITLPYNPPIDPRMCALPMDAGTGDAHINGAIVSVKGSDFTFDTCPPNADCAGSIATATVEAPGLGGLESVLPLGRVRQHCGRVAVGWVGRLHRATAPSSPSTTGAACQIQLARRSLAACCRRRELGGAH